MSEIFRERIVEAPQEPEIAFSAPKPLEGDKIPVGAKKATEPLTNEEHKLDIWEGLNRKRYIDEIFDTHNTSHEFLIKMPTSEIDKFVRSELEKRGYEKTIDNYKSILEEIEGEIGSSKLELFKRFNKITGYIRAINKLNKAKELKAKYLTLLDSD